MASGSSSGNRTFNNIALAGKARTAGRITLSPAGLEWASLRGGDGGERKKRVLRAAHIKKTQWCRFGSSCQLKVVVAVKKGSSESKGDEGTVYRFDGFHSRDHDAVADVVQKQWRRELEAATIASSGCNWGELNFENGSMEFKDPEGKTILEVPNAEVSQCALPAKNEVEIQFVEDDTAGKEDELLVEMRLYVPPTYGVVGDGDDDGDDGAGASAGAGSGSGAGAGAGARAAPAQALQESIRKRAGIVDSTADAIAIISQPDPFFQQPRGRYEVELFSSYFRMKGKTYDFKIQYKHVARYFVLPRPDGYVAFVISLDEPIRQGKRRYQHLVMRLDRADVRAIDVTIPEKSKDDKRFAMLQPHMEQQIVTLLPLLFKSLTGRHTYLAGPPTKRKASDPDPKPGVDFFVTSDGVYALHCAVKSNEGLLFPLNTSFFFIHNPATRILFSDIQAVEFQRYSTAKTAKQRTFDLRVSLKETAANGQDEIVFSSIDRNKYDVIVNFLKLKKIPILNLQGQQESAYMSSDGESNGGGGDEDDDSEDDSDFEAAEASSGEEAEDAEALAALVPENDKPKGKKKRKAPGSARSGKPSKSKKARSASGSDASGGDDDDDDDDE